MDQASACCVDKLTISSFSFGCNSVESHRKSQSGNHKEIRESREATLKVHEVFLCTSMSPTWQVQRFSRTAPET